MCSVCEGYSSSACPVCGPHSNPEDCPDCEGVGHEVFYVYDEVEEEMIETTIEIFLKTPKDKRFSEGKCKKCEGSGIVYR